MPSVPGAALITGATSGIGLAFARAVAGEGYDVVLVARDEARLRSVADELTATHGIACTVLVADLADLEQTKVVEQRLREHPVDLLINNAGFGLGHAFESTALEDEQRAIDVMVTAVMRLTKAALGPMLERGKGDVINVSSVAGFMPRGTYGAHKAWVTSFSRWCHVHYRSRGVRVLALCPGFVRTEFHSRMDLELKGIPSFMWLDADDTARAGLRALRAGKSVEIPTLRYRALVWGSRLIPSGLTERIARRGR